MRLQINVEKRYVFAILGLIAVVGFVIAQQTPNPGHLSDNIFVPASVSGTAQGLNSFLSWLYNKDISHDASIVSLQTGINNHENAIINLQNRHWTPSTIGSPYYSAFFSTSSSTHSLPSSIPTSAREVLVYVHYVNQVSPMVATIYTQPTLIGGNHYYNVVSGSSDNLWLPVGQNSPNRVISVSAPGISQPGSVIQVIGYR